MGRILRSRGAWAVVAVLAAGCGGADPSSQFEAVIGALQGGRLSQAYASLLPPSYDRDLNRLFSKARGLLEDEEVQILRDLAAKAGEKVAPVLAASAPGSDVARLVAERIRKLPELLALEDAPTFRSVDVRGLLARVDAGLFADLVKLEAVRARLAGVRVRTVERERNWARLLFTSRDAEGREAEDRVEVILVDGRWVPKDWVVDWPKFVEDAEKELTALADLRKEKPGAVRETLRSAGALLDRPDALVKDILGRFGPKSP